MLRPAQVWQQLANTRGCAQFEAHHISEFCLWVLLKCKLQSCSVSKVTCSPFSIAIPINSWMQTRLLVTCLSHVCVCLVCLCMYVFVYWCVCVCKHEFSRLPCPNPPCWPPHLIWMWSWYWSFLTWFLFSAVWLCHHPILLMMSLFTQTVEAQSTSTSCYKISISQGVGLLGCSLRTLWIMSYAYRANGLWRMGLGALPKETLKPHQ